MAKAVYFIPFFFSALKGGVIIATIKRICGKMEMVC